MWKCAFPRERARKNGFYWERACARARRLFVWQRREAQIQLATMADEKPKVSEFTKCVAVQLLRMKCNIQEIKLNFWQVFKGKLFRLVDKYCNYSWGNTGRNVNALAKARS